MSSAKIFLLLAFMAGAAIQSRAAARNILVWQTANDRVTADVHGEPLFPLLEDIAHQTGWHIFVDPDAARAVDVKFANLAVGDALRKLLGNLNYALVPQTNGPDFLYVFTKTMRDATKPVTVAKARFVANQLMIRVKPGKDVEALAKKYGAKIVGRDDKLHIYLLQFDNQADADAARAQLQKDPEVEAVGSNYIYDPPSAPQSTANGGLLPPVSLALDPSKPGDPCNPIVSTIDTGYMPSGTSLDQFVMPSISVADGSISTSSSAQTQSIGGPELVAPQQVSGAEVPTHGTAMVQTILRAISQVTSGGSSIRILPVDVFGNNETTTSWKVALGVQAAINNGATVINMSLGSTENNAILDSVIQQGEAQGIVFFASAGNTPVSTPTYPAAISGVNAVTALGAPDQLASYANFGNFVEMALPGASVVYLGSQAYIVQGTSPASAYAAGIAAAMKTINCDGWSQIIPSMAQKFPVPAR